VPAHLISPAAANVVHNPPSLRHLKVKVDDTGFLLDASEWSLAPTQNLSPGLQPDTSSPKSAGGLASLPILEPQTVSM